MDNPHPDLRWLLAKERHEQMLRRAALDRRAFEASRHGSTPSRAVPRRRLAILIRRGLRAADARSGS